LRSGRKRYVGLARLLLSCGVIALSGCGTLVDTLGDNRRSEEQLTRVRGGKVRIYGGVRYDAEILYEGRAGWLLAIYALDCPLSVVVDTVLLPFTVPYNLLD
jgi:uncharacterized protein YceK